MKTLIPRQMALSKATRIVPYLTPEEVRQIAEAVKDSQKGERNSLLITLLFQTGLRISEALALFNILLSQIIYPQVWGLTKHF